MSDETSKSSTMSYLLLPDGTACDNTLKVVREAIQHNGRVQVSALKPIGFRTKGAYPSKQSAMLHRVLESEWTRGYNLLMHRLRQSKAHAGRVDALVTDTSDRVTVELDVAKLLCLPGLDPVAELKALDELLTWIATQMIARPAASCCAKFMNSRDDRKRVYGEVHFNADASSEGDADDTDALSAEFTAKVAADPVLAHLVREIALSLGKLGPWSWLPLDEVSFFDQYKAPHFQFQIARARREMAAEQAAAGMTGAAQQ